MSKPSPSPKEPAHVLPVWFEFMRRHVVLSLLILAEFVVNAGLVVRLVVSDMNHPETWTWYQWVSAVVLAPAIGLAVSGVALALSQTASDSFGSGKIMRGIFTLVGLLGFASVEVWASLVERSDTVKPSSADNLIFSWIGAPSSALTPSVIVFAFLLPLAVVFVGFTNKPPVLEDEETWEEKQRRRVREAEYKAQVRAAAARGLGAALAGGLAAARGTRSTSEAPSISETLSPDKEQLIPVEVETQSTTATELPHRKGPWTKEDLLAYVEQEYPRVTLSEAAALDAIKAAGKGKMKGTAYVATITACKSWARHHYGVALSDQTIKLVG